MQAESEDHQSGKQAPAFKYEYFLKVNVKPSQKQEAMPWIQVMNNKTNKMEYLVAEYAIISRSEIRNKIVGSLRVSVFVQVFYDQLCVLVKNYQASLSSGNTQQTESIQKMLFQFTQYFYTLRMYKDFEQSLMIDKTILRKILEKFDQAFLYTSNMFLLLKIAMCFLPVFKVHPTNFNFVSLDLSLPDSYYLARLESLYEKYEKYFTCKEQPQLSIQKTSSRQQSLTKLNKQKSSVQQKMPKKLSSKEELQSLSLEQLLFPKGMRKIAQHLDKQYIMPEDKSQLLIALKCLSLKSQASSNPNSVTNFLIQHYNFVRRYILDEDIDTALTQQRQIYEAQVIKILSQLEDPYKLQIFMYTEPRHFLYRGQLQKRLSVGVAQKFIAQQIQLIQQALKAEKIPDGLLIGLLNRDRLLGLIHLVLQFVENFENIFNSTNDVNVYRTYVTMFNFLRQCYLSFAHQIWYYPLELMTLINSQNFQDFHMNIQQDIKDLTKKMVVAANNGLISQKVYFQNGIFIRQKNSKLQFVQAIRYYLKDCGRMQNNFLQFDQAIPTDFESSVLLVQLVRMRFHQLQPNQQQKTYYTTLLEQCMKHNVNPKFSWFRGFNYNIITTDRNQEFQLQNRIKNPVYVEIIRNILNIRQQEYANKAFNEFNVCQLLESLKFARGFQIAETDVSVSKDSMVFFGILDSMTNLVTQTIQVINPSLQNQIISQYLDMCVTLYNDAYPDNTLEQYRLMLHNVYLKMINNPWALVQPFVTKYPILFEPRLYTPDIVIISESIAEIICNSSDTRDGIIKKMKSLLNIIEIRCKKDTDKNTLQTILQEITVKFMSILSNDLHPDIYLNITLLIWRIQVLNSQQFIYQSILGPQILNKLDILKYFKRKSILQDQNHKQQFLNSLINSISTNYIYTQLSPLTLKKIIHAIQDLSLNTIPYKFQITKFKQQLSKLSTQYLLLIVKLTLLNHRSKQQGQLLPKQVSQSLIHIISQLVNRKKKQTDQKFDLIATIGINQLTTEKFISMIKSAKLQKQWLYFVQEWGTQQDLYTYLNQIAPPFQQIRKFLQPKTVLRMGCDQKRLQIFLKNIQPFIGTQQFHNICIQLVNQCQNQLLDQNKFKNPTFIALIMEIHIKYNKIIQTFLFKNISKFDFNINSKINDTILYQKISKAIVNFVKLVTNQYKIHLHTLTKDMLRMDASQRAIHKNRIDYIFNLLNFLPAKVFDKCIINQKDDDVQWQSDSNKDKKSQNSQNSFQQQNQQQKSQQIKQTKKSKKKIQNDQDDDQDLHQQLDNDNSSDSASGADGFSDQQIQQDQITKILCQMRPGYQIYQNYIQVRQCLHVAIRQDYQKLQKDQDQKNLQKQIQNYLDQIMKLILQLNNAKSRILQKMNPYLLSVLKKRGLKQQVNQQIQHHVAKMIKTFEQPFSDSDYSQDTDDDNDDDDDDNQQQYIDQMEQQGGSLINNSIGQSISQGNQQHIRQNQINNLNIQQQQHKSPQQQQQKQQQHKQGQQPQQIQQQQNQRFVSLQQLFGQLFYGQTAKKKKIIRKISDIIKPYKQPQQNSLFYSFKNWNQRLFNQQQFDKTIGLVLYKMFLSNSSNPLRMIYGNLLNSHYCGSIFINSIIIILRIFQKPDANQFLKHYPLIQKDYPDAKSNLSFYSQFTLNALQLLESIPKPQFYSESDPPINSVQHIQTKLQLEDQPLIVSLARLLLANHDIDQTVEAHVNDIMKQWNLSQIFQDEPGEQKENKKEITKIKLRHIETICRDCYRNEVVIDNYDLTVDIVSLRQSESLKVFIRTVGDQLDKDVQQMHKKIQSIQQYVINNPTQKTYMIGVLNDLSRTYVRRFDVFYYSLKSLLKIYNDQQNQKIKQKFYKRITTNPTLIRIITIALHHLNFYNQYFVDPQKPLPRPLQQLLINQLTLVNIAFLVFGASKQKIALQIPDKVKAYLSAYLLKPGAYIFQDMQQVINLIQPLLGFDMLCLPKYQKILLPPIFKNPQNGYHLPVNFRLIDLNDQDDGSSQMLQIRRGCSFDMAFFQLRRSRFRIQYYKEQGNDQGGLRREFMIGWQGFGIGEEASFIGKILAIAFRDQLLYGGRFDVSMALALTGYKIDLRFIEKDDPQLYKSLLWMKNNPVAQLQLDFTHRRKYIDVQIVEELKPGGKAIMVTDQNKYQYIDLMLKKMYFGGREKQMQNLRKGFFSIVPQDCVRILTPHELQDRISGVDTFNIEQLQKNVTYEGYSSTSEIVQWFWKQVTSFDFKERQTFLHFLTGTHKLPHGLKNYSFTIERVNDIQRLPVAHTCFNTLDLPEYTTYSVFKQKFRTAVFQGNDTYGIM